MVTTSSLDGLTRGGAFLVLAPMPPIASLVSCSYTKLLTFFLLLTCPLLCSSHPFSGTYSLPYPPVESSVLRVSISLLHGSLHVSFDGILLVPDLCKEDSTLGQLKDAIFNLSFVSKLRRRPKFRNSIAHATTIM